MYLLRMLRLQLAPTCLRAPRFQRVMTNRRMSEFGSLVLTKEMRLKLLVSLDQVYKELSSGCGVSICRCNVSVYRQTMYSIWLEQ